MFISDRRYDCHEHMTIVLVYNYTSFKQNYHGNRRQKEVNLLIGEDREAVALILYS